MTRSPQASSYDPIAKALHWLIATLILVQFIIGWSMPDVVPNEPPEGIMILHVAVGVAIIIAVVARVIWRVTHRVTSSSDVKIWLRYLGRGIHALLYVLFIAVPVLGWANASARGWSVRLGALKLPSIAPLGSEMGLQLGDIHSGAAILLAFAIGLHTSAGLYHHFVLRDQTLRKMFWSNDP